MRFRLASRVRAAREPGVLACSQPLVGPTWAEVLKLRRRAAPVGRARTESMAGAGGARTGKPRSRRQASDSNDLHTAKSRLALLRLA